MLNYTKTVVLVSQHPPKEVMRLLTKAIEWNSWHGVFKHHPLQGKLSANGFKLERTYKPSLWVEGTAMTGEQLGQSHVDLRITNNMVSKITTYAFMAVGVFIFYLFNTISGFHSFSWLKIILLLAPTALIITAYKIGYGVEAERSILALKKILLAEEVR